MLLDYCNYNLKILSVLELSWNSSNAYALPRDFHALSFRTTGKAHYTFNERELSVNKGDVLFVPENIGYNITAESEKLYVIHFKLPQETQDYLEVFHMADYAKIHQLFKTCYEIWKRKQPGYYFQTLSIFYNILGQISASRALEAPTLLHPKLKPAMDYIHSHYTTPDIDVLTLCRLTNLSDTWFRKLFMKCYGVKPITYLNTLRINYAKELLSSGYYTVETIAEMTGFKNPKYFCTVFKQYTGLPPSVYKNEMS